MIWNTSHTVFSFLSTKGYSVHKNGKEKTKLTFMYWFIHMIHTDCCFHIHLCISLRDYNKVSLLWWVLLHKKKMSRMMIIFVFTVMCSPVLLICIVLILSLVTCKLCWKAFMCWRQPRVEDSCPFHYVFQNIYWNNANWWLKDNST